MARNKVSFATGAYLAALAIESGCEWVSFDRDFARFTGLSWHSPADDAQV